MLKINFKLFSLLIIALFTFSVDHSFAQETVTITTFYPSPVGVYQNLLVTRGMAIGDTGFWGRFPQL